MVTVSTGTLGNQRLREDRPIALAVSSGGDLSGYEGEKPRELDWSSLVGTCGLLYYYICMYVHVYTRSTDECSRIFRYLVA